jgi:hypothetical protein
MKNMALFDDDVLVAPCGCEIRMKEGPVDGYDYPGAPLVESSTICPCHIVLLRSLYPNWNFLASEEECNQMAMRSFRQGIVPFFQVYTPSTT